MSKLVAAFRSVTSVGDLGRARIGLQRFGTPSEVAEVAASARSLPAAEAAWIRRLHEYCLAGRGTIQSFRRATDDPTWTLFRGVSAPEEVELVIGFTGASGNLFQPSPVVLQQLDASRHDMLLLRDPERTGFLGGAGPHRGLRALVLGLRALAEQYASVVVLGASAGGAPAALIGPHIGARRAVSMGGMLRDTAIAPAYREELGDGRRDPLTDPGATERWAVFGAECTQDIRGAIGLQAELPDLRPVPLAGIAVHSIAHACFQRGTSTSLYALLLGPSPVDDPKETPTPIEDAAPVVLVRTFDPPRWADPETAPPVWHSNTRPLPPALRRFILRTPVPRHIATRLERFAHDRLGMTLFLRRVGTAAGRAPLALGTQDDDPRHDN